MWGREAGTPPTMRGSGSGGLREEGQPEDTAPCSSQGRVCPPAPRSGCTPRAAKRFRGAHRHKGLTADRLPQGSAMRTVRTTEHSAQGKLLSWGLLATASSVNVLHFQRAKYFPVLLTLPLPQPTNSHLQQRSFFTHSGRLAHFLSPQGSAGKQQASGFPCGSLLTPHFSALESAEFSPPASPPHNPRKLLVWMPRLRVSTRTPQRCCKGDVPNQTPHLSCQTCSF